MYYFISFKLKRNYLVMTVTTVVFNDSIIIRCIFFKIVFRKNCALPNLNTTVAANVPHDKILFSDGSNPPKRIFNARHQHAFA